MEDLYEKNYCICYNYYTDSIAGCNAGPGRRTPPETKCCRTEAAVFPTGDRSQG